jgi:hypothetical protein
MIPMFKPSHNRVDPLASIFLPITGEVEISHGCFDTGMSEVLLNSTDINTGFKKVGRIRMAKMGSSPFAPLW